MGFCFLQAPEKFYLLIGTAEEQAIIARLRSETPVEPGAMFLAATFDQNEFAGKPSSLETPFSKQPSAHINYIYSIDYNHLMPQLVTTCPF